jgi:SAM-dependent methyltransferase
MKSYKAVVSDRYDRQISGDFGLGTTMRWMPSQLYLSGVLYQVLRNDVAPRIDLSTAKILEVGCGDGRWTRFIAEITHKPENITGTDLSKARMDLATQMNPAIKYAVADLMQPIDGAFACVLAWDIFMHLESEEEIRKALRNINDCLSPKGLFVFFDAWAKSHFTGPKDAESWGYHPDEITRIAKLEGFKPLSKRTVFRVLPGGRHSEQYYGSVPTWFVHACEAVSPTPGNFFVVFEKERVVK